ncbi:amino acid adenylation domain-containing protein, partial [Rhodococcus sp. NPDC058514]|uniref:non-ribosomal peptide synthetase n=1 Tax=Rhodococcus sp. NPDC058514 TaxID=3346532 RepID=UPI003656D1D6
MTTTHSQGPAQDPYRQDAAFPLSAVQRSMWFSQQLSPTVPASIAHYIELHGDLDLELLRASVDTAALEFQSPMLKMVEVDGEPHQVFDETCDTSTGLVDFRGEPDPIAAAHAWIDGEYTTPVDVTRDRLIDTSVLQVGDRDYLWYARIHHVVLDGYGGATLINRIAALYTAAVNGTEPEPNRALPVRDLYDLDQKYRNSDRFASDRQYWAEHIVGIESGSTLARREAAATARSSLVSARLSDEGLAALEDSDHRVGATSAAVIIAAFGCYLARMTGERDLLINLPVSGRTTAQLQRSGGMLATVAPLHITVTDADTVADLVTRVQLQLMGALRHQRCSVEDIRRDAGLAGGARGLTGPMVNVMLFNQVVTLGSMVGGYHIVTSGPVEDLLVNIYKSGADERTLVDFRGNPNRYDDDELRSHHGQFVELLEEFLTASPSTRVGDIHSASAEAGVRQRKIAEDRDYWARALTHLPAAASVPLDRPRQATPSGRTGHVDIEIDRRVHRRMADLAWQADSSVFTVMHTALAVLLGRLADTDDVAVGTVVDLRQDDGDDSVVPAVDSTAFPAGSANVVVLRSTTSGAAAFSDQLARIRDSDRAALRHSGLPYERVLAGIGVEGAGAVADESAAPPFRVLFEFGDRGDPEPRRNNLRIGAAGDHHPAPDLDLRLSFTELTTHDGEPAGIAGRILFQTDLYDRATVAEFADRIDRVLQTATADPELPVGDIRLLGPAEFDALTPVLGAPGIAPRPLPDLLSAAAAMAPDNDALTFEGATLTYRELDRRSTQLARLLIGRGVGPEMVVALSITRSADSVLALWSVAKTGAAFVPVDPNYPPDRVAHMLPDSGAVIGLAVGDGERPGTTPWLDLHDPALVRQWSGQSTAPITDADRTSPLRVEHAAYLIYTSGSTGLPKGVVVTHRALANLSADARERFAVTPASRTLHFSSPSFDASILELLLGVGAGATMVIAPPTLYGGAELAGLLSRERVTHAFVIPAVLASIDPEGLDHIECVLTGGDVCPPALVTQWGTGRALLNGYGPTETTVIASASAPMSPGARVGIGRPFVGYGEMVLDARLDPVPVGVSGELYITGPGIARGYHRRPATTAERFVANPHSRSGELMYRTGDLVRWARNGGDGEISLEYLGRTDFQIKIRGFRIELGEIDAVLRSHPSVC